jgi:hypothetical protein
MKTNNCDMLEMETISKFAFVKCFSELPVGQIGCAPVPLEAQVRRGLTAHTSLASPPEHQPMPVTPAKNATPFSNLQEGLEEPVEEMVSARFSILQ